ncbi:hypothetical protein QBC40DRAFT_201887 [Triangularia verruculosa]|uniref:Uncharacterized protein n=1 Tax=Triangularia verruculosa TaxID=2587418 RepID=A0AAN6XFJ5_9PEZI|nr:hypothetical protein QBC40DRAFT_201887 [Triangularia verruculosa]
MSHEKGKITQQPAVPMTPLPVLPFSCNILDKDQEDDRSSETQLLDQFPASYRADPDDLRAPTAPELDLIAKEMNVKRLHGIIHLLWLAGRPVPPRPRHYQLALGREITVIERMEAHLVWGSGRIYLKPLPRYLLNPAFWANYLSCNQSLTQPPEIPQSHPCGHPPLKKCALGFLLSYVALIAYENDFAIAKDKRLIPAEITWPQWRQLVREILAGGDGANRLFAHVNPRFIYGELRLNRLNLIFFALQGPLSTGFVATWNSYGAFYRDNSAWIITFTAYIILILSAAQVGLSTTKLAESNAFQEASYGFTIFSIVVPVFALGMLVGLSVVLWAYNVMRTRRFEAKRSKVLNRAWREEKVEGITG